MITLNFKKLIDNIELAYILCDTNGNIIYRNIKANNLLAILNIDNNSNVLNAFKILFSDFDIEKLYQASKVFTYVDKNKFNYFFKFKIDKHYINSDKYYIVTISDITEYQNELTEAEIYKTIFDCVASTIIVTDTNGTIEKVNPAFQELTGYTKEEAIGKNPKMLSSGYHSTKFFEEMWKTLGSGEIWRGILRDKIKSGELIWENSVISPIKDSTGNIIKYISIKENITKQVEQEEKLKEYAYQDALTGLYNRRKFSERAKKLVATAQENELHLFCLMIDLDNFKMVNDIYGHEAGNKVLVAVADLLKENVKGKDIASRYGGEEFIVILAEYNYEEAIKKAEQIKIDIGNIIIKTNNNTISVTASMGFAKYNNTIQFSELIENADKALYQAKNTGKNRVCEFGK